MRRRLPPLKQLVAFEAVARRRSFTVAADDLCLTNGAVSRQVKTLEEHFNEPLFRRLTNGVELTAAGRRLLRAVQSALDGLEATTRDLLAEKQQGTLVVGCSPSFAMRWLVHRLPWFRAVHPGIEVHVARLTGPGEVRQDAFDVAIALGVADDHRGFVSHRIVEERHGPVCSPGLTARGKPLEIEWLAQQTLLHTTTHPGAWAEWFRACGRDAADVSGGPRFAHAFLMLQAVATGQGVGVGSQLLVSEDIETGHLLAPFGFVPSGRDYCLFYSRERAGLPKVRAFRDWVLSSLRQASGVGSADQPRERPGWPVSSLELSRLSLPNSLPD